MSKIDADIDNLTNDGLVSIEKAVLESQKPRDAFGSIKVPSDFSQVGLFSSDVTLLDDVVSNTKADKSWLTSATGIMKRFYNNSINDISNCEVSEIFANDFKINKI